LAAAFDEAKAHLDAGRLDAAAGIASVLVADHPEEWRVHHLMAAIEQRAGRLAAANESLIDAIRVAPGRDDLRRDRARVLLNMDHVADAEDCARTAVELGPNEADNWLVLGRVCRRTQNIDDAEEAYRRALALDQACLAAHVGLGLVATDRGDPEAAETAYRAALRLDPDSHVALYNLANALAKQGRHDDAIPLYRRALDIDPNAAGVAYNLARVLLAAGAYEEGLAACDQVLLQDPENATMHFIKAAALLVTGRLADGWREYAWRWKCETFPFKYRDFPLPKWTGEVTGKEVVLFWAEQGIGDEIMFANPLQCAPLPPSSMILECDPRLIPLVQRSFPEIRVVPRQGAADIPDTSPPPTHHAPLADLAALVFTDDSRFPRHDGYLKADPARVADVRRRLAIGDGPLIGVSWRTTGPKTGDLRTIELDAWAKILGQSGLTFLSLQYGDCAAELESVAQKTGVRIIDDPSIDPLKDLDGLAAQVAATDLVISIDNSTVHMAGGLGRPVWTLLPAAVDCRWQLDRGDSPWYPSMRLFRQKRSVDWSDVIDEVAAALRGWTNQR
jgi:tetratricopeptide (TPR) repeat protein